MEEGHGNEPIIDLTNSIEPNSQAIADQVITADLRGSGKIVDDDLPMASGKAYIGELLYGRYRIVSLIAKGGMGEVYKARNESIDKLVAVKVLSAQLAKKKDSLYRFMREISSVAALKHPNLISVSDIGLLDNDCPYYVMEFVEGKSLAEIIATDGPLEIGRTKAIFMQLSGALAAAHEHGFIHRDIKPSNILVGLDDNNKEDIKLIDFGITKRGNETEDAQRLTSKGTVFGSPLYMSPEQCEGKVTDARSDVYSACCTMYECLKGIPPFRGDTPLKTMTMHKMELPLPLNLSGSEGSALESIIMKGLAKDPQDRFLDAKEMLACLISGETVSKPDNQNSAGDIATSSETRTPSSMQTSETTTELRSASKAAFWLSPTGILVIIAFISVVAFLVLLQQQLVND